MSDSEEKALKHSSNVLDLLEGVEVMLLDIEGTTTPISFVKVNWSDIFYLNTDLTMVFC